MAKSGYGNLWYILLLELGTSATISIRTIRKTKVRKKVSPKLGQ